MAKEINAYKSAVGYTMAKKQIDGLYKLFWRGTQREVFYGERFHTAQEAKTYFKVMEIKGLVNKN